MSVIRGSNKAQPSKSWLSETWRELSLHWISVWTQEYILRRRPCGTNWSVWLLSQTT